MEPHEIRIPFPLDMLGDLETTLNHVEERHLIPGKAGDIQEGFHPLAAAVKAIRAAIASHRAKAVEGEAAADRLPLERSHLATLMDFAPDGSMAADASANIAGWLDREA